MARGNYLSNLIFQISRIVAKLWTISILKWGSGCETVGGAEVLGSNSAISNCYTEHWSAKKINQKKNNGLAKK